MRVRFLSQAKDLETIFLLGRVKRVWAEHGHNMVKALEQQAGVQFQHGVTVQVAYATDDWWGGAAGRGGRTAIRIYCQRELVDTYDEHIAWLLMHELGHRLLQQHGVEHRTEEFASEDSWHEAEHRLLFAFLIPAIHQAFDKEFADRLVRTNPEIGYEQMEYGHTRAWRWVNAHRTEAKELLNARLSATIS